MSVQNRRHVAELVAETRSFLLFLPIDHFQAAPLGRCRRLLPALGTVAIMCLSYFWHDQIPRSQSNLRRRKKSQTSRMKPSPEILSPLGQRRPVPPQPLVPPQPFPLRPLPGL